MLAATLLPGHAFAQSAGQSAQANGDIIVTARRREEAVQSVPIAITAISEETLQDFRIQDASSLQALEPSFSVSASSGRPNSPVYSLRGIRPTESIYGQDPTVAIYLADVVQSPAQGSNLGFYDLQNIQVLKGPQGTLFGRNTIGGAILLTPRKPGDEFGGNVMVGAGTYGLFETEAGIDIPVADTFKVRIAGRTIDGGHYQTYVNSGDLTGRKIGGEKTRSLRTTIVGEFTPDITNTMIIAYDNRKTRGRGSTLQAVNPDHPQATQNPALFSQLFPALERAQNRPVTDIESDLKQYDNVEAWSVTNTTEARVSDGLTIKLIGNYREVDTDTLFDLDATSVAGILTTEQSASLNHHSVELQFQGSLMDDRLDWLLGGFYYHEDGTEDSPGDFYGRRLVQSGEVNNSSYSIFGQGSFKITPELTATAGVRMNWDKKELTLRQTLGDSLCLLTVDNGLGNGGTVRLPISNCSVALKDSFSQPTGTVSLDYKINPDVLVYVTSRLGYRSGGFNIRASQPVQYQPFQPETALDFEGGLKSDWWIGDVKMRTNASVFYQLYDDIQRTVAIPTPIGSPASVVTNAAAARVFGIELQQTIRPTDFFTLQVNYVYNKPTYKNWIDPATNTDLSDTPFFFTPRHSGNAMARFDIPLEDGLGELYLSGNAAYVDDQWINALQTSAIIAEHPVSVRPLLKQEAYWLVDLSAGWRNIGDTGVDLNIYVKNLFDQEYKVGGVQLYTGATGFISAAYGPPRTAGAQLRYSF
ncbi:TonB-dependent receptor [Novosphingobium sp. M1R2S20]|uniref:TonB-dependent receptor n=1 Tax=Novosphingobium rhizovicinum TaxID=3228928 RepID=A0ABV3REX3_9SPHN